MSVDWAVSVARSIKRSYNLSVGQMRMLWHMKHTLALLSQDVDKMLEIDSHVATTLSVTALKLQELLYNVSGSDKCNPYSKRSLIVMDNKDMRAIR